MYFNIVIDLLRKSRFLSKIWNLVSLALRKFNRGFVRDNPTIFFKYIRNENGHCPLKMNISFKKRMKFTIFDAIF
jgi:hypothetical protein